MFESQVAHAQQMIERLRRCKEEGAEHVPADVPVTESELSAWYGGVYDAFAEQFGNDSKEFKHFMEVRARAQSHIRKWGVDLIDPDKPDEQPEPAYIRYLQTMTSLLIGYAHVLPNTKTSLRYSFTKGFLPWVAGIGATVVAAGIAKWLGWV